MRREDVKSDRKDGRTLKNSIRFKITGGFAGRDTLRLQMLQSIASGVGACRLNQSGRYTCLLRAITLTSIYTPSQSAELRFWRRPYELNETPPRHNSIIFRNPYWQGSAKNIHFWPFCLRRNRPPRKTIYRNRGRLIDDGKMRYDAIGEFNADSKAEYSALSGTRSQKKRN